MSKEGTSVSLKIEATIAPGGDMAFGFTLDRDHYLTPSQREALRKLGGLMRALFSQEALEPDPLGEEALR